MMSPLGIAAIGCGHRTRTYAQLAAENRRKYEVTAAADPVPERVDMVRLASGNPEFQSFQNADAILDVPKLADVMIIGTQDRQHHDHAISAMRKGYDLLLEKPIATSLPDILEIQFEAERLERRVLVCHVLRYTPFYKKIKEIVSGGLIGDVICVNATEGVGSWHHAHSYVRGHWAVAAKSSPMILAKSCHDLDIMRWIIDKPCRSVSSEGALNYFRKKHMPEGAPFRCMDGCPVEDKCHYHAKHYSGLQRNWLEHICDLDLNTTPEDRVLQWVHESPWGRCVYQCDNDVVDHQSVMLDFEGGVTGTFTMTAFEEGRHLELFGTKARLRAGGYIQEGFQSDILVRFHDGRQDQFFDCKPLQGGYEGHGGGDVGLIDALYEEMTQPSPSQMTSSLEVSVESHRIALAAETARQEKRCVSIDTV